MAEPFLAELRIFPLSYAPKGWALCNGQFLPINQNQPLFSLLGTTFGGNGQTTFALPNLQARTPMHMGSGHTLGEAGGQAAHTVTIAEMPQHVHFLSATTVTGNTAIPGSTVMLATSENFEAYRGATNLVSMHPGSVTSVGGSQAHENRMPYLGLAFCIALQGLFPTPN